MSFKEIKKDKEIMFAFIFAELPSLVERESL